MAERQGRSKVEWRTSEAVALEMNDGSNCRNSAMKVVGNQAKICVGGLITY